MRSGNRGVEAGARGRHGVCAEWGGEEGGTSPAALGPPRISYGPVGSRGSGAEFPVVLGCTPYRRGGGAAGLGEEREALLPARPPYHYPPTHPPAPTPACPLPRVPCIGQVPVAAVAGTGLVRWRDGAGGRHGPRYGMRCLRHGPPAALRHPAACMLGAAARTARMGWTDSPGLVAWLVVEVAWGGWRGDLPTAPWCCCPPVMPPPRGPFLP